MARRSASEDSMTLPAFKLAPVAGAVARPSTRLREPAVAPAVVRRRARLADLDCRLHRSIIGTCMTTAELRKLVARFAACDVRHASDLEIHEEGVCLAGAGGDGCKALQKALDERHAASVRRFGAARDPAALLELWNEAVAAGDVPGAYWAAMTHPDATPEVRQAAFGQVHMLSHLVGAANRADIRRLVALEKENAELREKVERQQARLHEAATLRDAALREAEALRARLHAVPQAAPDLEAEAARLRDELGASAAALAREAGRRDAAEQQAAAARADAREAARELAEARARAEAAQAEAEVLERTVETAAHPAQGGLDALRGRRIVYVGGRPGTTQALKALVESAGGAFAAHDGGIEDRKGLLAAAVARADLVVFPVDCIDHDPMARLKRTCERHQVPYSPLRTAGVGSFIALAARLGGQAVIKSHSAL